MDIPQHIKPVAGASGSPVRTSRRRAGGVPATAGEFGGAVSADDMLGARRPENRRADHGALPHSPLPASLVPEVR